MIVLVPSNWSASKLWSCVNGVVKLALIICCSSPSATWNSDFSSTGFLLISYLITVQLFYFPFFIEGHGELDHHSQHLILALCIVIFLKKNSDALQYISEAFTSVCAFLWMSKTCVKVHKPSNLLLVLACYLTLRLFCSVSVQDDRKRYSFTKPLMMFSWYVLSQFYKLEIWSSHFKFLSNASCRPSPILPRCFEAFSVFCWQYLCRKIWRI